MDWLVNHWFELSVVALLAWIAFAQFYVAANTANIEQEIGNLIRLMEKKK